MLEHTWSSKKRSGPEKWRGGGQKFLYPFVARKISRESDSLERIILNEHKGRR